MSLLFRILYATHANGTHHKLALDALTHLRGPDAEAWRRLFLANAETYLEGSKAPDKEFKDFTNHVLHVRDGYWGGAAEKAMNWYAHLVVALKARNWDEAAYAAGVLSHYYTDPIMPFHTAQSEAENNIHRAVEWSISKSYNALNAMVRKYPMPDVPIEDRDDWLADLVCDAAEISNGFYEKLIANYDIDRGVVDPPQGLNERAQRMMSQLLAYAQVGQARILERAFAEAGVTPPEVSLNARTTIAGLKIPLKWVLRKMSDAEDRRLVTAMYDELQATGKVDRTLPEDDRQVRDRFRVEVGYKSPAPRPTFRPPHVEGAFDYATVINKITSTPPADTPTPTKIDAMASTVATAATRKVTPVAELDIATPAAIEAKTDAVVDETPLPEQLPTGVEPAEVPTDEPFDQAATLRQRAEEMEAADRAGIDHDQDEPLPDFRLHREDEVEDGPSVGPKTAIRLNKIGIVTVADLLAADPRETADGLDVSYIKTSTVIDWQDQARMQCDVPGLSGTASQLIVASGFRTADALADADIDDLQRAVEAFAASSDADRILRDRPVPDSARMTRWISNARRRELSVAA